MPDDFHISTAELNGKLVRLANEWDKTEEFLKIAELATRQAMDSAVWELRYAGRRVVDAIVASRNGKSRDDVIALIEDAIFDGLRARHDAIDACNAYVAEEMELAVDIYGVDRVRAKFPDLDKLFETVERINSLAVVSRKDREARERIYQSLHDVDFPLLAALFGEFRKATRNVYFAEKRSRKRLLILAVLAGTAGGSLVAVLLYLLNNTFVNAILAATGFVATLAGAIFGWLSIYAETDRSFRKRKEPHAATAAEHGPSP